MVKQKLFIALMLGLFIVSGAGATSPEGGSIRESRKTARVRSATLAEKEDAERRAMEYQAYLASLPAESSEAVSGKPALPARPMVIQGARSRSSSPGRHSGKSGSPVEGEALSSSPGSSIKGRRLSGQRRAVQLPADITSLTPAQIIAEIDKDNKIFMAELLGAENPDSVLGAEFAGSWQDVMQLTQGRIARLLASSVVPIETKETLQKYVPLLEEWLKRAEDMGVEVMMMTVGKQKNAYLAQSPAELYQIRLKNQNNIQLIIAIAGPIATEVLALSKQYGTY